MRFRPRLRILLKALLFIALVYIIFTQLLGRREAFRLVWDIGGAEVGFLFASTVLATVFHSAGTCLVLRNSGLASLPYFEWFKIVNVSRFINLHLPQGGNIYRGVTLKRTYNYSYADSIGMMSFFSWFQMLASLLFSGLVAALTASRQSIGAFRLSTWIFTALTILAAGPFVGTFLSRSLSRSGKVEWFADRASVVVQCFRQNLGNLPLLGKMTLLIFAYFLIFLLQVQICFSSIGVELGVEVSALFAAATLLSRMFSLFPGNLAVSELIGGYLSAALGHHMSDGIIVIAVLRIVDYLTAAVLALYSRKSLAPWTAVP